MSVNDKVIVVTGSGRGIGRDIALRAAREGAKVVVNDLGVAADGSGLDATPAEEVVRLIREQGGDAVANLDSISEPDSAQRIIDTAIETYGRVDVVINNAGFLRDRIFHRMSPEEWQAVIHVHLDGYFYVSRAAAPFFKDQGSGAFVHFTSPAGLIGSVGQANYAAAKMGVVGLSTSIAHDMRRYGVRSNCIAPSAWTRLVAGIPVADDAAAEKNKHMEQAMGAEKISPLAVFLASDDAAGITGQIFKVRGNEVFLMSQPRPIRSVHRDGGWDQSSLRDHMLPALRDSFVPLETHLEHFSWETI
ncbi:SDR family oxidoreductase [Microbacterium sp. NPDC058062]|uniref:SDR family oxidoreductase n=1 Tax=Microbacterium sp. NPDC058062 TaxID=3346320 RepID=UPI0036DAB970